jgi:uncharacterized protein (TIGR02118 family)
MHGKQIGIVRMGMIRRLPSLTPAEFRTHWRGPHGTYASKLPNLRRYHQNHALAQFDLLSGEDPWRLDGLSELWFDDFDVMRRSVASPTYATLADDTPTVMTMPGLIAGEQEVVRDGPMDGETSAKLMLVLGRKDSLSDEAFHDRWRSLASAFGTDALAIRNTRVSHREGEPGRPVARAALPVDLVCEIWFAAHAALTDAAAGGPLRDAVGEVAETAGAYQMQTHVIVA